MISDLSLDAFEVEITDAVATVWLRGPGPGNAMGPEFFEELPVVMTSLGADPHVRAIVLAGRGDHFCSGLNLKSMAPLLEPMIHSDSAETRLAFLDEVTALQGTISSVAECPKPVIAAVSGWCIGGGVDLIAAADIRLAASNANFSIREAKLAIVADIGSLQRLVDIVGDGHLRQLAMTGEDFDAEHAARIGLVNAVHDSPELTLAAARAIARRIAANSPLVTRGIKNVLGVVRRPRVDAGLQHVAVWNAAFLGSEDLREALSAFADRRAPNYVGR